MLELEKFRLVLVAPSRPGVEALIEYDVALIPTIGPNATPAAAGTVVAARTRHANRDIGVEQGGEWGAIVFSSLDSEGSPSEGNPRGLVLVPGGDVTDVNQRIDHQPTRDCD